MFQLLVKMDWVVNHNLAVYPKTSNSNLSMNYILSYWDKKESRHIYIFLYSQIEEYFRQGYPIFL